MPPISSDVASTDFPQGKSPFTAYSLLLTAYCSAIYYSNSIHHPYNSFVHKDLE